MQAGESAIDKIIDDEIDEEMYGKEWILETKKLREKLETEIMAAISGAADEAALEAVRVGSLGKKGSVSTVMKSLGTMTPDERKEMGPQLNGLKQAIGDALGARAADLREVALEARLASEKIDVTLPIRPQPRGTIHPVSQVWDEVVQIFADLGFSVAEEVNSLFCHSIILLVKFIFRWKKPYILHPAAPVNLKLPRQESFAIIRMSYGVIPANPKHSLGNTLRQNNGNSKPETSSPSRCSYIYHEAHEETRRTTRKPISQIPIPRESLVIRK